jgi:hypothetical protein
VHCRWGCHRRIYLETKNSKLKAQNEKIYQRRKRKKGAMIEEPGQASPPVSPQSETEVVVLIKKLQQQMTYLEKKIDMLIQQSQAAPAAERPYRSFDRFHRRDRGDRDRGFSPRGPSQGRPFDKRRAEESRGPGHKPYDRARGSSSSHENPFEKRPSDENREFRHKKRPFFQKRRG